MESPTFVAQLASYNAAYNQPFLEAWFKRAREFLPVSFHVLCVMQRVQWAHAESRACPPPENLKLATVCEELGILLGENAHDALFDAKAAASVYRALHGLPPLSYRGATSPLNVGRVGRDGRSLFGTKRYWRKRRVGAKASSRG
jgi:DNA polymerase III epsilon subunit-like protein